jgi:hypothetical protein
VQLEALSLESACPLGPAVADKASHLMT